MIEVSTKLSFKDKQNSERQSVFELVYATVVKIEEEIKDKKILEKLFYVMFRKKYTPN